MVQRWCKSSLILGKVLFDFFTLGLSFSSLSLVFVKILQEKNWLQMLSPCPVIPMISWKCYAFTPLDLISRKKNLCFIHICGKPNPPQYVSTFHNVYWINENITWLIAFSVPFIAGTFGFNSLSSRDKHPVKINYILCITFYLPSLGVYSCKGFCFDLIGLLIKH